MINETAILVVTYNRKDLLKENIEAILALSYSCFDLFIVDNCSTDGTEEAIKMYLEDRRVRYYNTGLNLGGAGGFSFGLNTIMKNKYKFCWIMDDDAIPEKESLSVLIMNMQHLGENNFSFLASTVKWIDGSPCKMNAVSIQKNKIHEHLYAYKEGLLPIENCSFVGCFVNLYIAKEIGLPIKEFFIYGDDSEYTLRLSTKQQAYLSTNSIIVHKMGSNVRIGIAEAPMERLERYNYEYRNRVYIYRKRNQYSYIRILLIYLKECVKVILRSRNCKKKRILIILKGLFKGITFNPQIEYPN
jgi:GT2 family glycosyltransferase